MLAQTKIAPVKSAILIIYGWFNYFIISYLLANTEPAKQIIQHLGAAYLSGDFSKMI